MASSSESVSNGTAEDDLCGKTEIEALRAAYPSRCRVICDIGQYKRVVTLQPENLDATIKFHLTAAYPTVIPDIKIRSESLHESDIEQMQQHLKTKAQELVGKEMIQTLMEEAMTGFKALGMRPGKVKTVQTETYIDEKSRKSKKKKNKQKSKVQDEDDEGNKKLPPMKTAEDVVNRIIWDDNLDTDFFLVGYIDRFRGLLEKYFTAFSWEDIATVDYDVLAIPKHRIQYFKYKNVKVWDKTKRLDNVFGSANGTKTIDVVMKEVEEEDQKQKNAENATTNESRYLSSDDEDDDSDGDDFITVTIGNSVNIGMSRADREEENYTETAVQTANPYWTDKLRPNYFICVRIRDPSVINGIGNVQDKLLQREPLLAECCIPGASLHVTICTVGLDTSEQLLNCMEALKKMKSDLRSSLPKSGLKIKGVSNFYNRVVYAKVEYEKEFLDFCDTLKLNLREAGVQIRDGYEFVPHITIVKVNRPVARVRGTTVINADYYKDLADTEFGQQAVDGIYLCSMGDQRRSDGFYLTPFEFQFDDSN